MIGRCIFVWILVSTFWVAGDEPPKKSPTPPPAKVPEKSPPPRWLAEPTDPQSPAKPFARGVYTTHAPWLVLFKPSGKLALELKGPRGQVLRVYDGDAQAKPPVPASLELVRGEQRLFCARGHRFLDAKSEDITGDGQADLFRVTHASGSEPVTYHQFLFEISQEFRVRTIGPFSNEK